VVENNIALAELGKFYEPYHERILSADKLATIDQSYARAYRVYCEQLKG